MRVRPSTAHSAWMHLQPRPRRRSRWRLHAAALLGAAFIIASTIAVTGVTGTPGVARAASSPITVPLDAGSPWPEMRHDRRNSGRSAIVAHYGGEDPWAFRTGRGIFSTPVIGGDGTVYVGSGDSSFYALDARGRLRWRLKTGGSDRRRWRALELRLRARIGSAHVRLGGRPAVSRDHAADREPPGPVDLPAHRRTGRGSAGQLVGGQRGDRPPGEICTPATPAAAPTRSRLGASSCGRSPPAIRSGPRRRSPTTARATGGHSTATCTGSTAPAGRLEHVRSRLCRLLAGDRVRRDRVRRLVRLQALRTRPDHREPCAGRFATTDHIYASPALGVDAPRPDRCDLHRVDRRLGVCALAERPAAVALRHGRSDPLLARARGGAGGRAPRTSSTSGHRTGSSTRSTPTRAHRRWSFDTTPGDPVLRDRNDLNASPALGRTGVYIAGEDGYVDYVPYDYCLHRRDSRCSTQPGAGARPATWTGCSW